MDPLSEVISLLEPKMHRVGGFDASGDWAIGFGPHEQTRWYAITTGQCWLAVEDHGDPIEVHAGDCFLLPQGLPFRLASDLSIPPLDWREFLPKPIDGRLTKINNGGEVVALGGHFKIVGPQASLLFGLLPAIVHLRSEEDREALRWAFERMRQELAHPKPGSFLIAQQLAHMILVQALRLHLDDGENIGWLFALSDKHIGASIAAIHREPARRWTVETLAAEAGMSRSNFAARFRRLVGDGPIEYLTRWRMHLASRSLSRGEPVGMVARALGYESESAFSTAFKRIMGSPPRRHTSG